MKRFYHIILSAIFLLSYHSFAQTSGDTVTFESFNSELLDSLVFEEVIQQRKANDLAKLFWSEEMKDTAEAHVLAMVAQNKIFYSALRKGQCILSLEIKNGRISYSDLSKSIVTKWLASPGHKKLLLEEIFIYGATAYRLTQTESGDTLLKGVFYISYEP